MEFPYLSVSEGLTRTFTLAYKFTDKPEEIWSERFVRFKASDKAAVYGGARVIYSAFPSLVESLHLDPANCAVVCALSSGDTVANVGKPIPFIANACAVNIGAKSALDAISKQTHAKIHTLGGNFQARSAELDKANYVSSAMGKPNVFIFDDFVTRGDTLSRVAKAILATNGPTNIYGIAIAKTERIAWCPNPAAENSHVPDAWNTIWLGGENEARGQ
jgi:hypothetical protein